MRSLSANEKDLDEYEIECITLIGEAENLHQIHLTPLERKELVSWFREQRWTHDNIRFAASRLFTVEKFGKLSPDVWHKASSQPLYTEEDVARMVSQRIQRRKEHFLQSLKGLSEPDRERKLVEAGLMEVQSYWASEAGRAVEKHAERIERKCKRLRAQFYHLPAQTKCDLMAKAVTKGLVKDGDKFGHLILPQLVPFMIDEFEEAVNNASVQKAIE